MCKMKYLLLIFLTGCGAMKTLDSLPEMSKSVERMSKRMDEMSKDTKDMSGGLKTTNGSLKDTASAIKSQGLFTALAALLTPDATRYITLTMVNPIGQIIPAKAIAESAKQEDLGGIFYLWITEINSPSDIGLTKIQKNELDLSKMYKLSALQTIAGFIPVNTLEELIKNQIIQGNEYEEIAHSIIMLRYLFISTYLLDQGVLSSKMTNPSHYEGALESISKLKYINDLPFKSNIHLKLTGFNTKDLNQDIKIEPTDLKKYYGKLKKQFDKNLNPKYTGERVSKIKHTIELGI